VKVNVAMGIVDRDLATHDADLASKVQVIPGLDVRLVDIDEAAGRDDYVVLQGLRHQTNSDQFWFYQRCGGTGTRGSIEVSGPHPEASIRRCFAGVFQEKTGAAWGSVNPGDRGLPGKYWYQQQAAPDLQAKWEYYVGGDRVDGKSPGWYPYDADTLDEMEEIYSQHVANACESRTSTRIVKSSYFFYKVDLNSMTQQNTTSKRVRPIRRATGGEEGSREDPRRTMKVMKAMKTAGLPMKAMKTSARTVVKTLSMKVMKVGPMKVMKAAKKKKVSKVGSKHSVLKGLKTRTKGGLKASDLMKSKSGKVVSKKSHAAGKKAYEKNLAKWISATMKVRSELKLVGFVKMKKGIEFYNRTRAIYDAEK
jgi:hypothetical protein